MTNKMKRRIVIFIFGLIFIIFLISGCYEIIHIKEHIITSAKAVQNVPTIIVDAGHGGEDGGAVAKDGTLEKDINLSISFKLKELLDFYGYNVIMTRNDDNLIYDESAHSIREKKVSDIRNRMNIINNNPDSILISVHQNHFTDSKYHGTQVFYSKNNSNSKILAQSIQKSVVENIQENNQREVKKTGTEIYLLYHAKNPAIMVECGFLSNYNELERLKDENYQMKIAFSIFSGIIKYMESNNTSNTEVTINGS